MELGLVCSPAFYVPKSDIYAADIWMLSALGL